MEAAAAAAGECLQPTNYDTYGNIIVSGARGGYGGGTGTLVRDAALSLGTVTISGTVTWTKGTHTFKELIISPGAILTTGEAVAGVWSYVGSGVGLGPGIGGYFGAGGAGHAGAGRAGYSSAGGSAYDSDGSQTTAPTDMGSSGGGTGNGPSGNNLSGYGGGALKIDVSSGTLTNNGTISVSGGSAPHGKARPGGTHPVLKSGSSSRHQIWCRQNILPRPIHCSCRRVWLPSCLPSICSLHCYNLRTKDNIPHIGHPTANMQYSN